MLLQLRSNYLNPGAASGPAPGDPLIALDLASNSS